MPKNLKQALLSIFLLLPFSAFAHGEEFLIIPLVTIFSVIIFTIGLIVFRSRFRQKWILTLGYIAGMVLTHYIASKFPYWENAFAINFSIVFAPLMAAVIAHYILKMRNKTN